MPGCLEADHRHRDNVMARADRCGPPETARNRLPVARTSAGHDERCGTVSRQRRWYKTPGPAEFDQTSRPPNDRCLKSSGTAAPKSVKARRTASGVEPNTCLRFSRAQAIEPVGSSSEL